MTALKAPRSTKLATRPPEFWRSCGIPSANILTSKAEAENVALKLMKNTGKANLLCLCDTHGVAYGEDDDVKTISNLMIAELGDMFLLICDFVKKNSESIVEQFDRVLSGSRASLEQSIAGHSKRKKEPLKPLTRAMMLYKKDPDNLALAYCRRVWRKKQTHHEFESSVPFDQDTITTLIDNKEYIEKSLSLYNQKNAVKYTHHKELNSGLYIIYIKRKKSNSIKEDFDNKFKEFTPFGTFLIGVDIPSNRIIIKQESGQVADCVRNWVETTLETQLRDIRNVPFGEYDGEGVQKALLGEYDPKHAIEITGIKFRRSISTNHSNLTIQTPRKTLNIREDLSWFRERKVLALTNLSDIETLFLMFRGHECVIDVSAEKSALVRFRFNDMGWDEDVQKEFLEAFKECFGIPLNLPINPTSLTLGNLGIYRSLLSCKYNSDVLDFQRPMLEDLRSKEILKAGSETKYVCPNGSADDRYNPHKPDKENKTCTNCSSSLNAIQVQTWLFDQDKALKYVIKALTRAVGKKLDSTPMSFSNTDFYDFESEEKKETVFMHLTKNYTSKLQEIIARFSQPVLIVHATGQHQHAYTDSLGQTEVVPK